MINVMLRFGLLLAGLAGLAFGQNPCAAPETWKPCDFVFDLAPAEAAAHPNPYATVKLHAEVRSPRKKTFLLPAFWDGGNRLIIRVTPTDFGEWDYRISSNVERFNGKTGTFVAAVSGALPFLRNANVHHWQTITTVVNENPKPHLWMGETLHRIGLLPRAEVDKALDAMVASRFTHVRVSLLGDASDAPRFFTDRPDTAYFREFDARIASANNRGLVVDLIVMPDPEVFRKMFPAWQQREAFVRYVVSRYTPYNITWQVSRKFEGIVDGRTLVKDVGAFLKQNDPYEHPKTAGGAVTASPLLGDQWMNYVSTEAAHISLGAVEHQLYTLPFVNTIVAADPDAQRKSLWQATMSGQYPVRDGGANGPHWKHWLDFFADTRYWELEPYFDVDGGRALALIRDFGPDEREAVEYIVYVEKPRPVEVRLIKHSYDVSWFNPSTGERIPLKKFKAETWAGEPPTATSDWVLHIEREGKKEGLNKSYKFESRPPPVQEIEYSPKITPFEIVEPAGDTISVGKTQKFAVKLKRETRGTRSMSYVWTGEVTATGQGFRILGSGAEGTFEVPKEFIQKLPAVLNLRLTGLNAYGKAYQLDKIYKLVQ